MMAKRHTMPQNEEEHSASGYRSGLGTTRNTFGRHPPSDHGVCTPSFVLYSNS